MKHRRTVLLGLLGIGLLGVGRGPEHASAQAPAPRAAWTVMVYSDADCNLEEEAISNIEEMMEIGSDAKLNIIVLADRSSKGEKEADDDNADADPKDDDDKDDGDDEGDSSGYTNRGIGNLGDWSGGKLLRVEPDHLHEIADWGAINTGDPAVLEKFIRTAAQLYPADRYALIVSDHGSGWTGACQDESANDYLLLNEFQQALTRTSRATNGLELLGFDACLMGTLEVTQALAPFARTFVVSEDLVPGTGWNYVPLLRVLKKHPETDGPALGEAIADSFRDYFSKADRSEGSEVTLSVINPARLRMVNIALNNMSTALLAELNRNGAEAWKRIARARARTLQFGGDDEDDPSSLVDLIHLAQELGRELPAVAPATNALVQAVRGAIVHNVRGKERVHANGLSIFFPPNAETLKGDDDGHYPELDVAKTGAWLPFLASYATLAGQQEDTPALKELRADGQLVDDERNVTVKCRVDENADQTAFAVAVKQGNRHVIVGRESTSADDSNRLEEVFNGEWYSLKCGDKEVICPILDWVDQDEDDDEAPVYAEVPVQIRRGGKGNWREAVLVFDLDSDADETSGELVRTYAITRSRVWDIKLKRGDQIRPMHEVIEANGSRKRVAGGPEQTVVVGDPKDVSMASAALDAGSYEVGFLATDVGGQDEHHFVDVKLVQ